MTTTNPELFACFWLDQNIQITEDNRQTQKALRHVINHLRTFDKAKRCEDAIRKIQREKIVLIVSGALGREIVPRIHDLSQLSIVYVYCQDLQANKVWAERFHKCNGVFARRDELIAHLTEDYVRVKAGDSGVISVINCGSESLQARNAMFMWFQLFIEVLLRMHHKRTDRQEFIEICRRNYRGNDEETAIIDQFEKNYEGENAIWWYTRESCLFRMLNKALRVQDFDMLFVLRFFISDMEKQLKSEYEKFIWNNTDRESFKVYRGQAIGSSELQLIQSSTGQFLSMNSFLSTSRDRSTARHYVGMVPTNENTHRILFEIGINPKQRTIAFADIGEKSFYADENEVLIMLGALFRIERVSEDTKRQMWVASVSLAREDDFQLKKTFAYMKETIGDDTDIDSLGRILIEMGQPEQARKFYQRLLNETRRTLGNAQMGYGLACLDCKLADESLKHFEEALQTRTELVGNNHADVGECYSHIGTVYWSLKDDPSKSVTYLQQALERQEKTLPPDSIALARTYHNIATAYHRMHQNEMAFTYYHKALQIREKVLPADHPDTTGTYNNLGALYEFKRNFGKSMECYRKALDSRRRILPPNHPSILQTEANIRDLQCRMN